MTQGELVVRASWNGTQVIGIGIESTRPHIVGTLLAGRTADEAVMIVPRVFSICGRSQRVAAALACDAAAGQLPDQRVQRESTVTACDEAAHEIVRRMLLDWPRFAGATPDAAALAEVRCALASDAGALRRIIKERLVGPSHAWAVFDDPLSAEAWLEARETLVAKLIARLARDRAAFAASDVALLPADGEAVARAVGDSFASDPNFEHEPTWLGAPAETGALARMRSQPFVAAVIARSGRSVLARFIARVVELVALTRPDASASRPVVGALSVAPGIGIGWVETARGLLVHAAEFAAGAIKRYRIVAPTEWNFHPSGALAAGIVGTAARSEGELRQLLRVAVESLDPCVAHRVEVVRV
ncbi:MAG: nickel-dependent hydrogenase large subunit [Burkholderiaceae bacterium]